MLKKRDIYLLIILFIIGVLISSYIYLPKQKKGSYLEIKVNGTIKETYPLSVDLTTRIETEKTNDLADFTRFDGYNILQIKDGIATITEANCNDKYCIHQKGISSAGESIVCLPHLLTITIISEGEDEPDAIAYGTYTMHRESPHESA